MRVINARNVNDAYRNAIRLMRRDGTPRASRNGPVIRIHGPVSTVYRCPQERVLFDSKRDANPFFHLFEALWMLSGANDVTTLDHILPSFKQFSDDGVRFHGAYGHRWRHWPDHSKVHPYMMEIDQIARAISMFRIDPETRRVVIGMWDPARDLGVPSKDLPCNDLIMLEIDDGHLNMMVCNRSNDIIWGCYGANAVHMSVLHEYMAQMIDVPQGTLTQVSFNWHAYLETPYRWESVNALDHDDGAHSSWMNPYGVSIRPTPLVTHRDSFDDELTRLITCIRETQSVRALDDLFKNVFLRDIAIPMHRAFEHVKAKEYATAVEMLTRANRHFEYQNDWLNAGALWIQRREFRAAQKRVFMHQDERITQDSAKLHIIDDLA